VPAGGGVPPIFKELAAFGGRREGLPSLDRFDRTYITLPCHLAIDDGDVAYRTEAIRKGW
jgi:hypothetical protein